MTHALTGLSALTGSVNTDPIFNPANLSNLFLFAKGGDWFTDTGATAPATTAGNNIRAWKNSAAEATPIWASTSPPVIVTESGENYYRGAAANSRLETAMNAPFSSSTISAVALLRVAPTTSGFEAVLATTSNLTGVWGAQWSTTPNTYSSFGGNANGNDLTSDGRFHTIGVTRNGTAVSFFMDGVPAGTATVAATATSHNTIAIGAALNPTPVATSVNVRMKEIFAANSVMTAQDHANAHAYLVAKFPNVYPPLSTNTVFFIGDSITNGAGYLNPVSTIPYVCANTSSFSKWYNLGYGGFTLTQLNGIYSTNIAPLISRHTGTCTAVVFAGTNDIVGNATGAATIAQLTTLCNAIKATKPGIRVVVVTCLPRTAITAGRETERQAYNSSMISGFSAYADALVQVHTDANLANPANTTYYADGSHLTAAGAAIAAGLIRPSL
jgi:lysophospholipase L1-like esterase